MLTERLVRDHRSACDPTNPESMYGLHLAPGRRKSGGLDRYQWHSVLIHFAPLELVNAIDQICHEHPLPTAAARVISQRFMTADLQGKDRAILEEFERRKRQ